MEQPRTSDPIALIGALCGAAPLVGVVCSVVPLVGMLAAPLVLLGPLGAVGFGIAGVVRARRQPQPNYLLPLTGVVLGACWLLLFAVGAVFFMRRGGADLFDGLFR